MAFGLFKKKKKTKKGAERYMTLTIREVVSTAKDAVNLVFEKPEESFSYEPGQFITIISEVGGKKVRRAYSLCTTPFEDEFPAVTVKRVPGGLMSNHIPDQFKPGDEVQIMEPMGMFTTEYNAKEPRHAVFIGGGSGITPLYSLLRSVLLKEPKSKVALVYGNRREEFIIFKEQLEELQKQFPEQFQVVHILEEDPNDLTEFKGRPTPEMIGAIVDHLSFPVDSQFYICGPEPMMKIASEGLSQIGIKSDQIRMESFEAGKTSPKEIIAEENGTASSSKTSEVTILMDGEEHMIHVPMNEHILEVGLNQDLDMPYSCQSGLCTACRGKCLEGEISLDEAEGISQDEIDEGYRLLCVGKPLTDKIKVEIG